MSEKCVSAKKVLYIAGIVVYFCALFFVGKAWAERLIVKKTAEAFMEKIKQGVDDQTMNEAVDSMISAVAGDGIAGLFLQSKVGGEDVNDIYHAMMQSLSYEVNAVEKTESGVYRVGLIVQNNDNIQVLKKAYEIFVERYGGTLQDKAGQLLEDLHSDKSRLIASLIGEAVEQLEAEQRLEIFSRCYVVKADKDGDISFENENGTLSFILACAGLKAYTGEPPVIRDEYKVYSILMVLLAVIGVASVALYFRIKPKTANNQFTDQLKSEEDISARISTSNDNTMSHSSAPQSATPMLYVQSDQHNNIPFAVHGIPILIGRDKTSCKVVFNEGTAGVSGRHCSVSFDSSKNQFILVDLRSTYGTYLMSGERLTANKQYYLRPGDAFFVGDRSNIFKVEIG